jgi:hypothetical protein
MTQFFLIAIHEYNLSNVIGFSFDLERYNDTCAHNSVLLQQAKDDLIKSIQLIRTNNSLFRIDNTGGIWMMYDQLPLGGSFELYKQHALMSVPGWDYYAWQLYRGNAVDPESDPESSDIYERIWSSVQFLGANKTIPLFGMTGVGDYGPNNCSMNNITCNFAGVIKDCKIARGLGVLEVQFYTLCDAGVYQNVNYPSMFDAYGDNFLDILNSSVNGLVKPEEIQISGRYLLKSTLGYWFEDVVYSITPVAGICVFLISGLMVIFLLKLKPPQKI